MKAILSFNLPEEKRDLENAVGVNSMLYDLEEFRSYLRSEYKYNGHNYTPDQFKVLEQIREKFYELLGKYT